MTETIVSSDKASSLDRSNENKILKSSIAEQSSDNENSRKLSSLLHNNEGRADKSVETVRELEEDSEVENMKKVEAALFISARFLNLQELVMLTDINPLMLKELLVKLIEKYNREDSAIELIVKDNMWKMDVRQEYVSMINKLATGSAEFTKAEQETLAVIAYKQPVKQSVIIKIRGNKAYEHIKHFRDIGLVQAKKAGHTLELKLSDDFFEYFHLQKKEEGGKIVAVEENENEDNGISSDKSESGTENNESNNEKTGDERGDEKDMASPVSDETEGKVGSVSDETEGKAGSVSDETEGQEINEEVG